MDDAGQTGLAAESDYAWLGVDATVRVWPLPEVFQSRVFADANYSYHHDVVGGGNASRFKGSVGLVLDDEGDATLNLEYLTGEDYETENDQEVVKTALKVVLGCQTAGPGETRR